MDTVDGRALRAARVAAGLSLSALASRTHYSKALLGHLETGKRNVLAEHVRAYEEALGVRVSAVESVSPELLRQAVDVVTAVGLRHGGMASLGLAQAHWEWAQGLLTPEVYADAARLVDRWAWSLADVGRPAVKAYRTALDLASGDRVVRGAVTVNLANHYTTSGQPDQALALLDSLGPVVPVVDFTAESARARAYSAMGEWESTVRHIGLADDAHACVDLAELPETHRPFVTGHDAHADNEAGKALASLAIRGHEKARTRAIERLSLARERFGPDRARARLRCEQRLEAVAAGVRGKALSEPR